MAALRIALFTLEALPNEEAVFQFIDDNVAELVFVGLSNANRANTGGFVGQALRHLKHSGPLLIPYLLVNFVVPDVRRGLQALRCR